MARLLLIFLGGGTGAVLRYLVGGWTQRWTTLPFPLGTLIVNISGCLLIGFLAGLFLGPRPINADWRFAILVGILGGYTTFSTFAWETLQLANDREWLHVGLNVVLSVVGGLLAVWIGRQVVLMIYGS
jgi:CrcB protein